MIGTTPTNRIRLSKKTGLPLTDDKKLKTKVQIEEQDDNEDEDDQSTTQQINLLQRKKGETSEERRARKHAIKDIRKVNLKIFILAFENF